MGPKVSQELFVDGVMATLLAVLTIGAYVAVRFEWQYGVGAMVRPAMTCSSPRACFPSSTSISR